MSAELIAALCMLASALGHAIMNVFNKGADDKVLFRGVFLAISATCCLPFLFFIPAPTPKVWMHLGISLALHAPYTYFMLNAYQRGDMGLVYPIMRGLAPVIAALVALVFLGETLPPLAIVALFGASAALIAFAWPARGARLDRAPVAFAVMTALMIAGYTVNDAAGVRAMGNPLTYIAWFFITVSLPIALTCFWLRRRVLVASLPGVLRKAAFASFTGFLSYSLALYALSLAPVAVMTSLRETSVVFGAILAALVLKEGFGLRRTVLAVLLAACLIALQAAS